MVERCCLREVVQHSLSHASSSLLPDSIAALLEQQQGELDVIIKHQPDEEVVMARFSGT